MANAKPSAGSRVPEPFRPLDQVLAETGDLLHEAGVQLALAESGTGGLVARLLRLTAAGANLTEARLFDTAEELAVALRVSPAKVGAFGAISAMVAAEAAADLIDTYEGGWGLVVMSGNRSGEPSVQSTDGAAGDCFVALGTPAVTIIEQCSAESLTTIVLGLLREQARRRLKRCGRAGHE